MRPEDLAPSCAALSLPARCISPEGPIDIPGRGRAWWSADAGTDAQGSDRPRDLHRFHPPGRVKARSALSGLLRELNATGKDRPLILGGFSQGAMLATELVLHRDCAAKGLVLLSSSRIAFSDWEPLGSSLRGLHVLVSHGRNDPDLHFSAGVALKEWLHHAEANVTWVPFEGGHQITLPVWRAVRHFVRRTVCPRDHGTHPSS